MLASLPTLSTTWLSETALVYIQVHDLITAIGSQSLCLLHLSAAFNTTDHNILIS